MANAAQARKSTDPGSEYYRLLEIIKEKSLLEGKAFVLSSGKSSSYFFDMKKTMLDPEGANLIAAAILKLLEGEEADAIGGQEIGAVPIVAVVCARSFGTDNPIPAFFVRKKAKGHGTDQLLDGNLTAGMHVVLVDDVTTTGGSAIKSVDAVRGANCTVDKVITVVDREEGAAENLEKYGITLVSIYTSSDFS